MNVKTIGTTRSSVVAAGVILLGFLILWISQPVLPGWACSASLPAVCRPLLLPVRASLVSAMLLLAAVIVGLMLRPRSDRWLARRSRSAVITVPVILLLTVVAHFVIPQP